MHPFHYPEFFRANPRTPIYLAVFGVTALGVGLAAGCPMPPALRAGTLFYLPILMAASLLLPGIYRAAPLLERAASSFPAWAGIGLLTVFFALAGLYWTWAIGEHSGDEGHYLIQAVSLHEDGDLDIRNNLADEIGAEKVAELGRDIFHVSPFSRGDHWHSFHPAGLPILLAPFVKGGSVARHLMLGLIAALAAYAVWRLCRRSGASVAASSFAGAGFFGSLYAIVYAARCLPEMLGAGLIAWLCWCVIAQADFPWRSAVLGGICCAFLPWVHLRFYPAALFGILCYGIAAARAPEPLPRKLSRLGIFLAIGLGGILIYRHIQSLMYEGGSAYAVDEVLFSYPPGLWRVFTHELGLLNVFPLAIGLIAAAIAWPFLIPARRWTGLFLAAMFGVVWLTSCGGSNYFGGATLGGRFLLAVVPPLLPAGAVLWDRASGPTRWWLLLLALISIGLGILELIYLPQLGRDFAYPYRALPVVAPLLAGLPTPFCSITHIVIVGALTLGAFVLPRRLAILAVSLIVLITVAWQIAVRI